MAEDASGRQHSAELDAAANDALLVAADADGRAAFVVDADGEIIWAGDAAFEAIGGAALDDAARRALVGMASAGRGGLLRLRLAGAGQGTAFRVRLIGGEAKLLAVEALAPIEPQPKPPEPAMQAAVAEGAEAEVAETDVAETDVALAEGTCEAEAIVDPESETRAPVPTPFADEDRPPDPRGPSRASHAPTAAVGEPTSPAVAQAAKGAPLRFIFEIDDRMRIASLSPELESAVGPSARAAVGRDWNEVASELGLDPAAAVAAALARRGSWSDIAVTWPRADGSRLPLALSALPMFDRGRSFVGFRGVGVATGGASFAEPSPERDAPATEPVFEAAPEPQPSLEVESEADDGAERLEPPILFEIKPETPSFTGNVVPLREAPSTPAALSSSEVNAFDEIARRLQGIARSESGEEIPADAGAGILAAVEDSLRSRRRTPGADELLRLIERLPVGALILRGGEVAHANRYALELLGCRELSELSGRGADALFAEALPQDRDAPAGLMRLIASNGSEVEVEARLSTIAWGGAPATLVTLRRPEADDRAGRDQLQRERELVAALDIASDGVLVLDGAGRVLSVNRGAESLFGFDAAEVVGSLFSLSLAPESRRIAFDHLDRLKLGMGSAEGVEVLGLSRHGGAIALLMTIGALTEAGSDRFCALLRDIGPWKRAEEELIAARRQAERANAQKSEFLGKVGHEIRTPLNAIIGFAEVMIEERFGPVGSPRYKDYLKDIHASGGHLVKMVDDLLDITRIETGRLKLDFGPVDLNEIASQAAALLAPQAQRDHVIIRTSLARGLPLVLADRRSIRQIMTTLAANAVKLSRPGGQVIVATSLTDIGQAVFRVRDAGAGMSKQEIARAFEPFRPLAVADNDSGFSLGLPLTRALAEANEAVLALQSELGRGTLAEVTFPASRVLAG